MVAGDQLLIYMGFQVRWDYNFPRWVLQALPISSAFHIPPFFNYVKMRFQILREMNIRTNVTSYSLVDKYLCFGGVCCLQLQGRRDFHLFYSENGDSTETLGRIKLHDVTYQKTVIIIRNGLLIPKHHVTNASRDPSSWPQSSCGPCTGRKINVSLWIRTSAIHPTDPCGMRYWRLLL